MHRHRQKKEQTRKTLTYTHTHTRQKRYKQHKFNLLREDVEGYAGLINDLTRLSIDNQRNVQGKLEPTPMERIPEFLTIISSRIGVFYLDPNRVLDIILDFFIKQLTINYKFWVELIKQSGWIQKLTIEENKESSTNPSAIMAQLFGFRFYNYHEECKNVPRELFLAIAILLKNNLILLGDLLPHVTYYLSVCLFIVTDLLYFYSYLLILKT